MTIFAAPAGAATPAACRLVNAAPASAVLAIAVTTVDRPNPLSAGGSMCVYMAGGEPIVQLAITVAQSEGAAQALYRAQQRGTATEKNAGNRQKRNLVLSAITMSGDSSRLNALVDLAVKSH